MKHKAGRFARATAVLVAAFPAVGVATAAGPDTKSFAWAQANLAVNPAVAVPVLDELARSGDQNAQYLLGTTLLEGKIVPRDRVLGLAFLQVAADSHWSGWTGAAHSQIVAIVLQYQMQMSGNELIRADQLTNAIQVEQVTVHLAPYTSEKLIQAKGFLTFEAEPVQINVPPVVARGQLMRLGCAAKRLVRCSGVPSPGAQGHCSGRIQTPDAVNSMSDSVARVLQPGIPDELRYRSFNTAVVMLMHVDSSGGICSAIVMKSSGNAQLDRSALDSISRSTLIPPSKAGVPIEGLAVLAITFQVP